MVDYLLLSLTAYSSIGSLTRLVQYSLEDPEKDVLDFGTLMEKAVMSMMFSVHNVNPIRVRP